MSITIHEVPLETVWQMRQTVMYPKLCIDKVKLNNDNDGRHLGLFNEAFLCSVVSLFKQIKKVQFRKFCTVEKLQGKGYGSLLLQHVFDQARNENSDKIWCNARVEAVPFYKKFGMKPYGETWEKHGRLFVKMQKDL